MKHFYKVKRRNLTVSFSVLKHRGKANGKEKY
jgi:hypothetical protein